LRFRACFTLPNPGELTALIADAPEPLNAPGWFDCFDAEAIGAAIKSGAAVAFLSEREIRPRGRPPHRRLSRWPRLCLAPTERHAGELRCPTC
jgi:hypothetical protein